MSSPWTCLLFWRNFRGWTDSSEKDLETERFKRNVLRMDLEAQIEASDKRRRQHLRHADSYNRPEDIHQRRGHLLSAEREQERLDTLLVSLAKVKADDESDLTLHTVGKVYKGQTKENTKKLVGEHMAVYSKMQNAETARKDIRNEAASKVEELFQHRNAREQEAIRQASSTFLARQQPIFALETEEEEEREREDELATFKPIQNHEPLYT